MTEIHSEYKCERVNSEAGCNSCHQWYNKVNYRGIKLWSSLNSVEHVASPQNNLLTYPIKQQKDLRNNFKSCLGNIIIVFIFFLYGISRCDRKTNKHTCYQRPHNPLYCLQFLRIQLSKASYLCTSALMCVTELRAPLMTINLAGFEHHSKAFSMFH